MTVWIVIRCWPEGSDIDSVHFKEETARDRASFINIAVCMGTAGGIGATVEKYEVQ